MIFSSFVACAIMTPGLQLVEHIPCLDHLLSVRSGPADNKKRPLPNRAEGGNTAVPPLFTHSLRNRPHGHLSDQCPCAVTCAHGSLTAPFRRFGSRLRDVFPPAVPPLHQPAVLCADKPGVLLPFFAYEGIKAHFAGKVKPRISGNSTGGYIWESISRAATRAASLTSPPMIRASSSSRPS